MTPSTIKKAIVTERIAWIRRMLERLNSLDLASYEDFMKDTRNVDAAESCIRRALEGLLDLGRHILAKGFGIPTTEYKEIAEKLKDYGILSKDEGNELKKMAGYRDRLIHFYQEVTDYEIYEICKIHIGKVQEILDAIIKWLGEHPEKLDENI